MASELIFNLILCLAMVFYLVQAFFLPHAGSAGDILGASGFPIILGCLGLMVLIVITCQVIRTKNFLAQHAT